MEVDKRRFLRWFFNSIEDYVQLHKKRQDWYNVNSIPYWQRTLHDAPSLYEYYPAQYLWEYHSKADLIAVNEPLNFLAENVNKKVITMAKLNKKQNNVTDWTMLSLELNSIERQAFKEWYLSALSEFDNLLIHPLENGYKMSLSYSAQTDMYFATITQTDDAMVDGRSSQTSQAHDPIKAIMLALYKFTVIGKGKLIAGTPDKDEDFR